MSWLKRISTGIKRAAFPAAVVLVLFLSLYFRAAGLFRDLDEGVVFHPDSPKQAMTLQNYLHQNYVVYQGSLLYDGYPYGLNRLDEGLIRLIHAPVRRLVQTLRPAEAPLDIPTRHELFYWGRVLRVLYGMLVVGLLYAAGRRWKLSRWYALLGAAVYGFSPLAAVVSHSVTGDIGVDMAIALSLYALAAYAGSGRLRWFLVLATACGFGFACKFQGMLGLWLTAIPFLAAWRSWKDFLVRGLPLGIGMAGGFIGAVLLAYPGLVLDTRQAWQNTYDNFEFIKNYGVPSAFLEKPVGERVVFGLGHNIPFVFWCIGYALMFLALVAMVWAVWRLFRHSWRNSPADAEAAVQRRGICCMAAMTTFPWLALILATALKPAVQPFHFTFLIPALGLGMVCWMQYMAAKSSVLRLGIGLLAILPVVEALNASAEESFFWKRPEIKNESSRFSKVVFGTPKYGLRRYQGRHLTKQFYTEPSTRAVFRSKPSGLKFKEAAWWENQVQLPVPSVPFTEEQHWIFMNGPVFPRNDRMFLVPASGNSRIEDLAGPQKSNLSRTTFSPKGEWTHKTVVRPAPLDFLYIGLRTDNLPSKYEIRVPGWKRLRGILPPNSQLVIPITKPLPTYHYEAKREDKLDVYGYAVKFRSQLGPVWVTLMDRPEELAVYNRYGPTPGVWEPELSQRDDIAMPAFDPAAIERWMHDIRYVGHDGWFELPTSMDKQTAELPGSPALLAAGAYVWTARIHNPTARDAAIEFFCNPSILKMAPQTVPAYSTTTIRWRFEKSFAPYLSRLLATSSRPGVFLHSWNIKPDADALRDWEPKPQPPPQDLLPATPLDIVYPDFCTIRNFQSWPEDDWIPGREVVYQVAVDLNEQITTKQFHESAIFLHLRNEQGDIFLHMDFPLAQADFGNSPAPQIKMLSDDLPPGRYTLSGGIYVPISRKQIPFDETRTKRLSTHNHAFFIRDIEITNEAAKE